MAGVIKIYRRFRVLTFSNSGSTAIENYTPINPVSLTADVYQASSGSIVESGATVTNQETGLYFADLNELLYNSDNEYEVYWRVRYNGDSPIKLQYTRFKFKMASVVGREIEVEIMSNKPLEFTVVNNKPLEFTVVNNHFTT
jgi:hypothetical protein